MKRMQDRPTTGKSGSKIFGCWDSFEDSGVWGRPVAKERDNDHHHPHHQPRGPQGSRALGTVNRSPGCENLAPEVLSSQPYVLKPYRQAGPYIFVAKNDHKP